MKRFFILAAGMLIALMANAQPPHHGCGPDWRERIRSERVAFLTSEMDLSPAEAEKFWPVYNQCQTDKREAQKAIMDAYRTLDSLVTAGAGGKELTAALDRYLSAMDAKNEAVEKEADALRKVLPDDKIARMYVSDEKFRKMQIHKLHEGRPGPPDRPGRPDERRRP